MSVIDAIWYGDGLAARAVRGALLPASWLYGAGVAINGRKFANDDGVHASAVPVLSLGNVSVGGTGKTPVAAWAAGRLASLGARPAIVMRGYGDDEPLVHARLNPDVPVIVDADRVAGVERARREGADCAILDDGFQHRRIARVSDWVLVSAERWRDDAHVLPAGPLREPIDAMSRAHVILVTRKSASFATAVEIASRLGARFASARSAVCHLSMNDLVDANSGERRALSWLGGRNVAAAAAVGDPDAFFAQLRAEGAHVEPHPFRDHHAFDTRDISTLAAAAAEHDGLVCTLKDAVKLAPRWPPAAAPLLYVSQIAVIEDGQPSLDHALEAVLAARRAATSTAG